MNAGQRLPSAAVTRIVNNQAYIETHQEFARCRGITATVQGHIAELRLELAQAEQALLVALRQEDEAWEEHTRVSRHLFDSEFGGAKS